MVLTENNLMGAAEWTGYSSTPTYPSYSSLPSVSSSYNYDSTGVIDHHSNFHIPSGNFNNA